MATSATPGWVGQVLSDGRYEVTAKLGEGGMGFVYRAHDRRLDCDVVLKVPRPAMLEDPEFAARFAREIRSLVRLSHPHIVKVTDVGEHGAVPFAVLQYLPGGSLRERQLFDADGKPVPFRVDDLAGWLENVAAALDYIHKQGYIHRDVKPDNILFDAHGEVYLSDFGVAKVLAEKSPGKPQTVVTGAGMIFGTPPYMAPELILGQSCDGRVDQYALAVMAYELLGGMYPFEGPSAPAIFVMHTTQKVPPLDEIAPALPPATVAAVHRALAKDPAQRFPDCVAFARAVLQAGGPPAAKAAPRPTAAPRPARTTPAGVKTTPRPTRVPPATPAKAKAERPTRKPIPAPTKVAAPVPVPAGRPRWVIPAVAAGAVLLGLVAGLGFRFLRPKPTVPGQPGPAAVEVAQGPAASVTPPAPPLGEPSGKEAKKATEDVKVPKAEPPPPPPREERATAAASPPAAPKKVERTNPPPPLPPKIEKPPEKVVEKPAEPEAPTPLPGLDKIAVRLPVPPDADQKKADRVIKGLFKADYGRPRPADQLALAQKLIKQAQSTPDDPATRYVLLREARDLSVRAGNARTALQAVEELARDFAVDGLALKAGALEATAEVARDVEFKAVADGVLTVLNDALAADNFDVALRLMAIAEDAKRKAALPVALSRLEPRAKEVREAYRDYQQVMKAADRLREKPDDAEANLLVGRRLCLVKDEWDAGLPLLARGGDPALLALARKDLAPPQGADAQVEAGDGWWDLAERTKGPAQLPLKLRAKRWYEQARPNLTGLARSRVDRRVSEADEALAAERKKDQVSVALLRVQGGRPVATKEPVRKTALRATVYACCDGPFELYVNGEPVLTGPGKGLASKDWAFSHGDVITVKARAASGGSHGFCCAVKYHAAPIALVTGPDWRTYQPQAPERWYAPGGIPAKQVAAALPGDATWPADLVRGAAGVAPRPVWGPGDPCYLVYVLK